MKLEEGMYVRTKEGEIHTIKSISDEYIEYENGFGVPYELREYILKASNNIIDLIEAGDYVNGFKVIGFRNDDGDYYLGIVVPDDDWAGILPLSKLTIYSIVTKEQFESMKYKLN